MSNKEHTCPVCAASMINTCRLCGYSDKKLKKLKLALQANTESNYNGDKKKLKTKSSKK